MPLLFDTVSSFLFDGASKKTRAVLPFKFPFHLCTLSSTSYWSSLCGWGVRDRSTYFASIRDRQWAWGLLSQPRDCHTLLQTTQAVTWCKTAPLFLYKTGYLRLRRGAWGGMQCLLSHWEGLYLTIGWTILGGQQSCGERVWFFAAWAVFGDCEKASIGCLV